MFHNLQRNDSLTYPLLRGLQYTATHRAKWNEGQMRNLTLYPFSTVNLRLIDYHT